MKRDIFRVVAQILQERESWEYRITTDAISPKIAIKKLHIVFSISQQYIDQLYKLIH